MNYKGKYLKYKEKYLKLKEQIGGETIDYSCKSGNNVKFIQNVREKGKIIYGDNYYFINLEILGKSYNVIVTIYPGNYFMLNFLDNSCTLEKIMEERDKNEANVIEIISNLFFMQIVFSENDSIKTSLNFDIIESEGTKLGTIMKILDVLYTHFCKDKIELIDVAEFKCPDIEKAVKTNTCSEVPIESKIVYSAIIYRIFGTDKDINNISIYRKYGYIYDCNNDDLMYVRQYLLSDFKKLIAEYITLADDYIIRSKTSSSLLSSSYHRARIQEAKHVLNMIETQGRSDQTVYDFTRSLPMETIDGCKSSFMFFNFIHDLTQISIYGIELNDPFVVKLKSLVNCVKSLEKKLSS